MTANSSYAAVDQAHKTMLTAIDRADEAWRSWVAAPFHADRRRTFDRLLIEADWRAEDYTDIASAYSTPTDWET